MKFPHHAVSDVCKRMRVRICERRNRGAGVVIHWTWKLLDMEGERIEECLIHFLVQDSNKNCKILRCLHGTSFNSPSSMASADLTNLSCIPLALMLGIAETVLKAVTGPIWCPLSILCCLLPLQCLCAEKLRCIQSFFWSVCNTPSNTRIHEVI